MRYILKITTLLSFTTLLGSGAVFSQVSFSEPGGFYKQAFNLTLTSGSGTIHYTLDGTAPTAQSPTYNSPLPLSPALYSTRNIFTQQNAPDEWWNPPSAVSHVIAIRAAAFDNNNRIGNESVNTYFVSDLTGYTQQLPMLSIVIDPAALFNPDSGIFSPIGWQASDDFNTGNFNQHGKEWERLAHIEFIEPNGKGFSQWLGLRVHGGKTRRFMQKPLKLYARNEYGKKNIDYPVFDSRPYSSYKRLVLKPFSASWREDGISDRLAQSIADPMHFVSLASRPVTLFINGEYWGIYYLQESPDERLVAQIDNVDADDVDLIGSWEGETESGSNNGFNQLMELLGSVDLSDSLQYRQLCTLIDVDDFIDYLLFEAFTANEDWPANNMRCFQHDGSPWRWIFYDGDACFSKPKYDMSEALIYTGPNSWPSSSNATLCFRRLLQSPDFLHRLRNRMIELNETVFDYTNTAPLLNKAISEVKHEVGRQSERFKMPSSVSKWEDATDDIKYFLRKRPAIFVSQMVDLISVSADANVTFFLHPNPTHDIVNIRCDSDKTGWVQCEIFDIMGRRMIRDVLVVSGQSQKTIDISSLPTGVYVVRLLPLGKTLRLVVQ